MKSGISVIIPIHEIDETTSGLLKNAVKSVFDQIVKPEELLFVIPKGDKAITKAIKECETDKTIKVRIIENEGETDFCSQMNLGVENVKTEHFSFLEFDDEYSKTWLKNAAEYTKAYPEVSTFLPIVIDVDTNGAFLGFTNEAVWANQFSDELGSLDLNALLPYPNFNIDGMVCKVSVYKERGGLKSKIKLTFAYEFLLRLCHYDDKVMTVPKFGYKHVNQRPGSLFNNYKNLMPPDESKWWMAQAKKEYYFDHDRVITYEQQ